MDWCQIYHAQMITALGSEPTRNFWLPAEIMNYSREVLLLPLQQHLSWCSDSLFCTNVTSAGLKMLDAYVQCMMHGTIMGSMSCGCMQYAASHTLLQGRGLISCVGDRCGESRRGRR